MCDEKKVYYLEDGGFVVMWNDKRGEEFWNVEDLEEELIDDLKRCLNLRDRIEFELDMCVREGERLNGSNGEDEEEKMIKKVMKENWDRIYNEIKKDYF